MPELLRRGKNGHLRLNPSKFRVMTLVTKTISQKCPIVFKMFIAKVSAFLHAFEPIIYLLHFDWDIPKTCTLVTSTASSGDEKLFADYSWIRKINKNHWASIRLELWDELSNQCFNCSKNHLFELMCESCIWFPYFFQKLSTNKWLSTIQN